ncbi:hypothetical protein [uncultured Desulfovibrio sp.]|uniref:hypothetical protein n=1 Tax=uncultured Desulfovibrio sp. TaxID=167968 RepID=UPI00261E614B|nr:hypothetical protein [uncultured Desulfovibrio sp.]
MFQTEKALEYFAFEKECEAAAQRRPTESERKNRVFSAKRQAVWLNAKRFKLELLYMSGYADPVAIGAPLGQSKSDEERMTATQ